MLDKHQTAQVHYRRGIVLEQAGRLAEAVEEYRQALLDNPRLREAHMALANYYQRHGLQAKAAVAWAEVVAIEADYEALTNLGVVALELGRYEDARRAFNECLRLYPDDTFAAYELGYIDYCDGAYQQALARLEELRPYCNDEWQLHYLMGNCLLRLHAYDTALASFGRAILLTNDDDYLEDLYASIAMVERYREFPVLQSQKDRLYAEQGVMYLGSLGDDGLLIDAAPACEWNPAAIATTLRRCVALAQADVWRATAIVVLNRAAEPLARVLAHQLDLPLRLPTQLQSDDTALLVSSTLASPAALEAIDEHVTCSAVVFALALTWNPDPGDSLPDLIGLIAPDATVPWEATLREWRRQGVARAQIDALLDDATAQIEAAWQSLAPDSTATEQIDYYRHQHRRLEFSE